MCARAKIRKQKEPKSWLENAENVRKIIRGFYGFCILIIVADLIFSLGWHKHAALSADSCLHMFETLPGFYGIVGLVGCIALVLVSQLMRGWNGRKFLKRGEDYWDR